MGGAARIDETEAEGGVVVSTDDVCCRTEAAAVSVLAGDGVV